MAIPLELEKILEQAGTIAREKGVPASDFNSALTDLGQRYTTEVQPKSTVTFSFKPDHYMIASFQNAAFRDGKDCGWEHEETYQQVNANFGTRFKAGESRGNLGDAYLVLERQGSQGKMWCYSIAIEIVLVEGIWGILKL